MTDKQPLRRSNHGLHKCPIPLKKVAGGFLFVPEHRRGKQLRGVRLMPFLERFGVQPNVVDNIREPTRVERPRPQVAHDLRFYLLDNLIPLLGQISAQIFGA